MTNPKVSFSTRLSRVYYFFPVQLILLQLRSNWFLLIFWALPFLVVTGNFGEVYGIPTTFFYPEYLGDVDFISHFMIGFSIDGFIGAYHIAAYIANGRNFPFIATLASPFYKYSLNNSFIPIVFLGLFINGLIDFQYHRELVDPINIVIHILALVAGVTAFLIIAFTYFFTTNKTYKKYHQKNESVENLLHKEEDWAKELKETVPWKIKTYIGKGLRIKLANPGDHYKSELLEKLIRQNHINASLFDVTLIVSVAVIGIFGENELFFIPAGASIFLILTLILMVFSAFRSWLKNWASIVLIALLLLVNQLSKDQFFNYINHAFGLKYTSDLAEYSNESFEKSIGNTKVFEDDIYQQEKVLTFGKQSKLMKNLSWCL